MIKEDFIALLREKHQKLLLNKNEAAKEIGISSATLDRLRNDGKIHSTIVGGQVFIRIDELAEVIVGGVA